MTRRTTPLEKKRYLSHFLPSAIKPAPENDLIYQSFGIDNEDDRQLVQSIKDTGIQEPLVLSLDHYLLSGHRRLAAAKYLGLKLVPVQVVFDIFYEDLTTDDRLQTLRRFNQQRQKSFDEQVNERMVGIDPHEAHQQLRQKHLDRRDSAKDVLQNVCLGARKRRARITTMEFRQAVITVVFSSKQYWPLTDRRIHYLLLNDPPRRHDKKPRRYANTPADYKALTNVLTRLRLEGAIPMRAIEDPTRPVLGLQGFSSAAEFVAQEASNLFLGYGRNLMQDQPNHVEIILEKNALRTVVEAVARDYCIPMTTGRGYCSLSPRHDIAQRFKRSGKQTLILLFLTDFDPDGEEIASSFARSMRDDFGIENMVVRKVLLTKSDVELYDLPSDMDAKPTSPHYRKFVEAFGHQAVELDAAPVELIQERLRAEIESVIDTELFNAQLAQEEQDAANIQAQREVILEVMKGRS